MLNEPSLERLKRIPPLYATEQIPIKEKTVHLHFFINESDWYAVEFDGEDVFFGYAVLNNDLDCAEWGYFSYDELKSLNVVGLEIQCESEESWGEKKVGDIVKIKSWD